MDDPSREIADLRLDIETLRVVIDVTSNGVAAPDALLRACANILYERHARIARLEATSDGPVVLQRDEVPEELKSLLVRIVRSRR